MQSLSDHRLAWVVNGAVMMRMATIASLMLLFIIILLFLFTFILDGFVSIMMFLMDKSLLSDMIINNFCDCGVRV